MGFTDASVSVYRMLQSGVFRDRKIQRSAIGMPSGRVYGAEMRDRSRSPRGGSKPLVASSNCETGKKIFCYICI